MSNRRYTSNETRIMNKVRKSSEMCYYCKNTIETGKKTVDHKIPISRGGETKEENLVVCCEECNTDKGFLTEEEYIKILELAKEKEGQDVGLKLLKSVADTYLEISEEIKKVNYERGCCDREITEIQNIIAESKLSASDGYKLCKELQTTLINRKIINKRFKELNRIKEITGDYKTLLNKINEIKKKIVIDCKREFIDSKDILLISNK